jgi:hypothetical protein
MSLYVRTVVLRAKSDFTADGQTSSIRLYGLPGNVTDPAKFISFMVKSDTPSGSSPTLDITIESSYDDSVWVSEGGSETQLTAAADNVYVPSTIAKYYRLDLNLGGSSTPTFGNLEVYAMILAEGAQA